MITLIAAFTLATALVCLVAGSWMAWFSARKLHRKAVQATRSGQLPMVEVHLMAASILLILMVTNIAVALILASGLWLASLA